MRTARRRADRRTGSWSEPHTTDTVSLSKKASSTHSSSLSSAALDFKICVCLNYALSATRLNSCSAHRDKLLHVLLP